ncbi:MAG: DUF4214 domain-containing protein [Desulfobulbaceae bacterium]|nr:DUF4214 domain-containing protein [Desulfobulbaceae bacterium]
MIRNKLTHTKVLIIILSIFCINTESIYASCEANFSWLPNSEPDIDGYRIYYGTEAGVYIDYKDIETPVIVDGRVTGRISNLNPGESYFFSATAYNTDNLESDFSDEISWTCPSEVVEEPVVEEPVVEEPVVEEPVVEEPVVEEPVVEEPVVEEPVVAAPVVIPNVVVEETVVEEPVGEDIVVEYLAEDVVEEEDNVVQVENFITRFYEECLYRSPDIDGLDTWTEALLTGTLSATVVAERFIFSNEFTNLNTTNEEFVTTLYKTFFNRDPDTSGYDAWVNSLNSGEKSREDALNGFTSSTEFKALCNSFGITQQPQGSLIEQFVTRFYEECLGRQPDQEGFTNWVNSLVNGYYTGADLAEKFIFSNEFENFNTSNEEYITILYTAFFNRTADTKELQAWINVLNNGSSREEVLNGFVASSEFIALCDSFGIQNK